MCEEYVKLRKSLMELFQNSFEYFVRYQKLEETNKHTK